MVWRHRASWWGLGRAAVAGMLLRAWAVSGTREPEEVRKAAALRYYQLAREASFAGAGRC